MDVPPTDCIPAFVHASGITKGFPGVLALRGAQLDVRAGEVHALVGENGAGKSTLMKILSGVYTPDAGTILLEGRPITLPTPKAAQDAGIVTIYQEFNLVPALSVAENIFLGAEPERPRGVLNWSEMNRRSEELLSRVGVHLDPRMQVSSLGVAQQQMIEIAKALRTDARLVIMDEPTAALSLTETGELFRVVRELQAQGVAVLFISHHLEEVFAISDRITVMRDGQHVDTLQTSETDMNGLIRLMVGRDIAEQFPARTALPGQEVLRGEGLSRQDCRIRGVSFQVAAGEVLGIGGLMGAGRTELLRAVFGADPLVAGTLHLHGHPLQVRHPADAVGAGIGFLTEDRKAQGLVLGMSVRENITLGVLRRFSRGPFLDIAGEAKLTRSYVDELKIRTSGTEQDVLGLSGGNQQKVLLSRWLALSPKVLLLDEPTRGVDVGAKVEIYRLINELAAAGLAIIMVSSDLLELLGMSDRILVMREGTVSGELSRRDFSQEAVMRLATGLHDRVTESEDVSYA